MATPVALVTGGGTGIGAATARRLSADGWRVAVTGRRTGPIDAVAGEIDGLAIRADQALPEDCERAVAATLDAYGRLDALVANAGVEAMGAFDEVDRDEWANVMRVNVDGVLLSARAAAPALRATSGSIVVVSSVAGLTSGAHYAAYVTSKTAVLGLVRSMAVDLGSDGVRVNAICPGWVATEMSDREVEDLAAALDTSIDQARHRLVEHLPLARMGEPSEIAAAIAFLAGRDASFVTGTTLVADGGGGAVDVGTLAFKDLPE